MIKKTYFLTMATLLGIAIFVLSPVASSVAQNDILPAKIISAGITWVVDKTISLNGLTIAEVDKTSCLTGLTIGDGSTIVAFLIS
jgi:hypothetical protein